MNATDTALRVIEWATLNPEGGSSIPLGNLEGSERLASPPPSLCQALQELTTVTAARLHLEMPFLGDNSPLSLDVLAIALALGTPERQLAQAILGAVAPPSSSADWIARHGLIRPALPLLEEEIADSYRRLSPLTSLFDRPAPGNESLAIATAQKLLLQPSARRSLVLHLARPTPDPQIRHWRKELLERLRIQERNFVLDVYEAMMIYHEQEAMKQVQAANDLINAPQAVQDEGRLRDALSIAAWWQPLWAIEREDIDLIRSRHYLGYNYREGIKLWKLSQKLANYGS